MTETAAYAGYLILLTITLLALVLSFAIVLQAYRGYRRNRSQPMLYLAIGLVLLTIVPFAISLVVASVGQQLGFSPLVYTYYAPITSRIIEVIGLVSILYSLYVRR